MEIYDTQKIAEHLEKHLKILEQFTATKGNGVTRCPFSKEAKQAAEYIKNEMDKIGLSTKIDLVGNVRGRLEATVPNAKTIIIGSHYDTVKNGGAYDGIAGVICGMEIAERIKKSVKDRYFALEIIAFNDEEGMMFGSGCLGSKALTGQIDDNYITRLTDENGISIREWMEAWGSDPNKIAELKLDLNKVRAFFEIHIEQGPILDAEKKNIGIVEGIVGVLRCMAIVKGSADHAGTTPMKMRKDAISIGTKVISQLDRIADEERNGSVATCGFVRAKPNAMNVIAQEMEFTMDIRSKESVSIERMKSKIWALLERYTKEVGATWQIDIKLLQDPVIMNKELVKRIEDKCIEHGYSFKRMVSGAAHDAMVFADKVDTVMVFVPSKCGKSHCPEEHSEYIHLAQAVQITGETIQDMISQGKERNQL